MKTFAKWMLMICLVVSLPALADDFGFVGTTGGITNFNLSTGQFSFVAPINAFVVDSNGVTSTYGVNNGVLIFQTLGSPTSCSSQQIADGVCPSGSLLYSNGTFDVLSDFDGSTGTTLLDGSIAGGVLAFQPDGSNVVSGFVGAISAGGATFFDGLPGLDLTQFNPPKPGAVLNFSVEAFVPPSNLVGQSAFSAVVFTPEPASFLLLASALAPLSFVRRRFRR